MNNKILVATHKDAPMPTDPVYLPVLVGADFNQVDSRNYQPDNQGDNISAQNPNFNELTALYWAWKNLKQVDAVGLVHYRRLFSTGHQRSLEKVLSTAQVEELLAKAPVVVPKRRHYVVETISSHYVHSHYKEPLIMTREVIAEQTPQYLSAFDQVMKRRSAHMFNMFIMKTSYFNDYCEWLFGTLFQVQARIDISSYSAQEARVFGYLSEILLDVWLTTNQVSYVECNWIQLGDRQLVKKAIGFLKRKFASDVGQDVTHY
ncbi:DUF4422 domain-containing protein [Fructilactobacillus florum]|uniref:DUF4422 domain-containing protein n=1 Tax=Fructilactobacillus florum TaxID=640331 RepID=UPI00028C4DF6|nr:DUF4422 domain-containing protein [Fructilactobacillus florum]EKK20486.1 Glycosyltransferase [Fructilactobacillus florum 2F]